MTTNNSENQNKWLDVERVLPPGQEVGDENLQLLPQMTAAEEIPAVGTDLEIAIAERNALHDRLARVQAEFENSRKRAVREQHEVKEFALAQALKALLPILDNLDRALQSPAQTLEEFRSGIQLIRKQFEDTVVKLGLNQIPAKGEPFDPHVHEAIEIVDTMSANDNQVLDELQRGYKLGEQLLRPAMVRVARNPKRASESEAP
jgi:molecular chaperone GrpE